MDKEALRIEADTPQDAIVRIREIVARLRGPDGCPWDKEQTLSTLKVCLIEEAYELMDVMDRGDCSAHREEMGDVLLQIIFQVRIREEQGDCTFVEVVNELCDKLIRRHPHVFGNVNAGNSEEVLANWEAIKKVEKGDKPRSPFAGVPNALPALLKAQRIQSKAEKSGLTTKKFSWEDVNIILNEVKSHDLSPDVREEKIGKLLFAISGIAKEFHLDAETALQDEAKRFMESFTSV